MKLATSAVLAVAPLVLVASASAQIGVYGTVTAQHLGGLSYSSVGSSTNNTLTGHTDGAINPIGGTGGIYYGFRTLGPVRLGVDARGSVANTSHGADPSAAGSGGRLYTVMGGLRGTFPAHYRALAPYAQASFGLARTDAGSGASTITPSGTDQTITFTDGRVAIHHGFAYEGLVGLDIKTLPLMDIRLFEFGIGGVSGVQNQPGTHLLEQVSIGIVLHLPY